VKACQLLQHPERPVSDIMYMHYQHYWNSWQEAANYEGKDAPNKFPDSN